MKIPEISIIVPAYNADKYLNDCLESIKFQTFTDYEVIIVNDGSCDNTAKIANKFCISDPRFKLINKEKNEGLVAARKTGINIATGKYIGYVDADDWIDPDMYMDLYHKIEKYSCDFVSSGIIRQFADKQVHVGNSIADGYYSADDYINNVLWNMLYHGIFYDMGIRINLVNKLFLREKFLSFQNSVPEDIKNGEDVATFCSFASQVSSCWITNKAYYHYRQQPESMTKEIESKDIVIGRAKSLYRYLSRTFNINAISVRLNEELRFFIAYLLVQKCCSVYDTQTELLKAFGTVDKGSKIVVYGAGNFGKQIWELVNQYGFEAIQVDRNAAFYIEQGLDVHYPEDIEMFKPDIVLIALIDEKVASNVRKNLMERNIDPQIIRWLDVDYISSKKILERFGFR